MMMTHEMGDAAPDPDGDDQVHVHRRSVDQLYRGVRKLVGLAVALGLVFTWDAYQDSRKDARQDAADEHLAATDQQLKDTAARLAALVEAEAEEAARDEAQACVTSHVRFALLGDLLVKLGAATELSQSEVDDLVATYPAPACDLAVAKAVLAAP